MGRSLGVVRAAASALLLRCSIGLSRLEILADARARWDGTGRNFGWKLRIDVGGRLQLFFCFYESDEFID